ncbi:hypothetical protein OROHE_004971 [Orobanche hederae]
MIKIQIPVFFSYLVPKRIGSLFTPQPISHILISDADFRKTSRRSPTARSATSAEKTLAALATAMPRRRHSIRSMWLSPALAVTIRRRDGRSRRTAAEREKKPAQRAACVFWAFALRNWGRGSGDSHGFKTRYLEENSLPCVLNTDGGPRTITFDNGWVTLPSSAMN